MSKGVRPLARRSRCASGPKNITAQSRPLAARRAATRKPEGNCFGLAIGMRYVEHILLHNVARKLLQCFRHVLKRRRSVSRSYALVCMAGDVIRHALGDAAAVCDLFESVTPSVIGLHMFVVNSQSADPICEPLTNLCVGRLLVFGSILSFAPPSQAVEQRAIYMVRNELEKTLAHQMFVQRNDARPPAFDCAGDR